VPTAALRDRLRPLLLAGLARTLPPVRQLAGPPGRLLLIRPDHLGDVLLTNPAVQLLRTSLPAARLTYVVGPWSAEVARRGTEVDELLTCPFPGFTRQPKRDPGEPYRLLLREARRLHGQYDLAIVFRPDHWWGALLARLARIPIRLGYATPTTRPLLSEALPFPARTHTAELNLRLARRAVAITSDRSLPGVGALPVFRIKENERTWASEIASRVGEPLVLLHPGSGSPLKNWPPARWAAVADALADQGARVVLTGGADDLAGPRAVAAAMRHEALVLAGRTTLGQLAALAERCRLAIGTDNGPLHLAAAVGAPTLRLYGPTDEAVFGPWGDPSHHAVLTTPLACRPCGNLVRPPCGARSEPPCLLGIRTEQVVEAALAMLR
jgi:heptosyltransferase-2/heptosyltransferase-3